MYRHHRPSRLGIALVSGALMVAIIFRVLDALRIFDLIYVMSGNNKDTMSMSVYARQQLVDFQDVWDFEKRHVT